MRSGWLWCAVLACGFLAESAGAQAYYGRGGPFLQGGAAVGEEPGYYGEYGPYGQSRLAGRQPAYDRTFGRWAGPVPAPAFYGGRNAYGGRRSPARPDAPTAMPGPPPEPGRSPIPPAFDASDFVEVIRGAEIGGGVPEPEPAPRRREREVQLAIAEIPTRTPAYFPNAAACWSGAKPPSALGQRCGSAPRNFSRVVTAAPCFLSYAVRGGLLASRKCPQP